MDIQRILRELRAERSRIDQAINAIESLDGVGRKSSRGTSPVRVQTAPGRRGRRRLSTAARKRLSQLLKQRWAQGKMKPKRKAA
jgi:hypothetical protein